MRLFAALRPPPDARRACRSAMTGIPDARWQDDEQLHVTLRFLGEVDERGTDDVCAALDAVRAAAVRVSIRGVGMFDRRGRVDSIWAAVVPREPLAALHKRVNAACVRAGLEPEGRAYLPHVTLARFSRGASAEHDVRRWLHDHAGLSTPEFSLDRMILYRSHLGREGASYEVVHAWPLYRAD